MKIFSFILILVIYFLVLIGQDIYLDDVAARHPVLTFGFDFTLFTLLLIGRDIYLERRLYKKNQTVDN